MPVPASPACPICGKPSAKEHFPFCSPRCRRVDLGRWLGEAYRVPVVNTDDPDEGEEPEDSDGGRG